MSHLKSSLTPHHWYQFTTELETLKGQYVGNTPETHRHVIQLATGGFQFLPNNLEGNGWNIAEIDAPQRYLLKVVQQSIPENAIELMAQTAADYQDGSTVLEEEIAEWVRQWRNLIARYNSIDDYPSLGFHYTDHKHQPWPYYHLTVYASQQHKLFAINLLPIGSPVDWEPLMKKVDEFHSKSTVR